MSPSYYSIVNLLLKDLDNETRSYLLTLKEEMEKEARTAADFALYSGKLRVCKALDEDSEDWIFEGVM